jgi:hypothetical protein
MKILKLSFGLSMLAIAFNVAAQDAKPLEANEWPTTVAATVTDIVSALSEADKVTVRETKRSDLIKFHLRQALSSGRRIDDYYREGLGSSTGEALGLPLFVA